MKDSWDAGDLVDLFLKHGVEHEIGFCDLYPPTQKCLDPHCLGGQKGPQHQELLDLCGYCAVLFTRNFGPLPVWLYSAKCPHKLSYTYTILTPLTLTVLIGCGARYYPNYYIYNGTHTYYLRIPYAIHVTMHLYVESSLCERFANSMVFSHCCACDGSACKNTTQNTPLNTGSLQYRITELLAVYLICDFHERLDILILSNTPHPDCLHEALEARNITMVGPGQKLWNHACEQCCTTEERDNSVFGHPCCAHHDCQQPLPTQQAKYCAEHSWEGNICCITSCDRTIEAGFQTCNLPDHRSMEKHGIEEHSAMFQLQKRLERRKVALINNSMPFSEQDTDPLTAMAHDDTVEMEASAVCAEKSEMGNVKLRARFGCSRTHSEQLCVATCGVVLGRATFYGSEAVNGVCQHITRLQDQHFRTCALPVDVFHIKSKHKESDNFCGQHCNLVLFQELMVDGKWRFNSSAAKMTNTWFGGFHSIVQEMRRDRVACYQIPCLYLLGK
ncbi:hypothetical protein HETIRDRAFT_121213 [Heterobasidion irregulare TC 32-1]|uniref:CxC6 like cysteine cluster associated with KDZ domain-containing protein n=1 Tax=Heterobasidion irregulare (strain TC 32-1) TaxID=747525 RepID=W4KLG6_HETIT|nr:uncharacterized protein HETIRDRAFT_121213 [Heterobasidion irregulare TC 32-1]ETW86544.1 hypothetical protein HETIRDRAFT_121213 [Heterobasidion irregulare TC 32-1]